MSDTDTLRHADDALELAALLRPAWPAITAGIRASGAPTCEGDDDGEGDGTGDGGGAGDQPETTPEQMRAEAEKWKALARKHESNAKKNADAARKLAELQDADKTEAQRAADKAADAEKRASSAEAKLTRLEVALDKAPEGMPLAKVRKLAGRLTGDSREDLEADAAELFSDFAPDTGDDGGDDGDRARRGLPKERLRPGAAPGTEPEETDPEKLAAKVPRPY